MSDAATLNSRIRVLIAKAFRAEKLYSSVVRQNVASRNIPSRSISSLPANSPSGASAKLSEMSNEVRAREWQTAQSKLRTILNELLERCSQGQLSHEIASVTGEFYHETKKCSLLLDEWKEKLLAAAEREEFAATFKLSMELIRLKARLQASHSISDELAALGGAKSTTSLLGASSNKKYGGIEETVAPVPKLKISGDSPLGEDLEAYPEPSSAVSSFGSLLPKKSDLKISAFKKRDKVSEGSRESGTTKEGKQSSGTVVPLRRHLYKSA